MCIHMNMEKESLEYPFENFSYWSLPPLLVCNLWSTTPLLAQERTRLQHLQTVAKLTVVLSFH